MGLQEVGYEGMDWIDVAQDKNIFTYRVQLNNVSLLCSLMTKNDPVSEAECFHF